MLSWYILLVYSVGLTARTTLLDEITAEIRFRLSPLKTSKTNMLCRYTIDSNACAFILRCLVVNTKTRATLCPVHSSQQPMTSCVSCFTNDNNQDNLQFVIIKKNYYL